ncbi:MAG TPA: PspA/IM30 family protein [Alteraurantiacibacter sp.]
MLHIAVQVRELVSSNISGMIEAASNPQKMLKLLRKQIEEAIIALQSDLTHAQRREVRLEREASVLDQAAGEWVGKAKIALDHDREDLARSAILAKEDALRQARGKKEEAAKTREEAGEIADAVALLEDKLAEARTRLTELENMHPAPHAADAGSSFGGLFADRGSRTERRLQGIERLEKRIDFASEGGAESPAPSIASVDVEISRLQQDAKVDAELAALKSAKAPAAKSARTKRTKTKAKK